MIKKIVVIGPESTGKSTLCDQLAKHYKTLWVPEFARGFLEKNGMGYSYEDLLTIAKGQIELEDYATGTTEVSKIFIDTDMYVLKVWSEFVFGKCHSWVLNQIALRKYDLYLLCNTDLAWVKDDLREYPDPGTRNKLYHYYKDLMINQSTPWVNISGDYSQRFKSAVNGIDSFLRI